MYFLNSSNQDYNIKTKLNVIRPVNVTFFKNKLYYFYTFIDLFEYDMHRLKDNKDPA